MNMKNVASITGEIVTPFNFSHMIFEEKFFLFYIRTERTSNNYDTIPVIVSERLIDTTQDYRGFFFRICGQYRSYNQKDEKEKSHLVLSLFANSIEFVEEEEYENTIMLSGHICKAPTYRQTPKGREIADVLLAVNRQYCKSDYIPCICWGRNAKYVKNMKVGSEIEVNGRIQSRTYYKDNHEHTAYEVSVSTLKVL